MLRNYITVAIRNLLKNRGHSLLNILGLSASLACAIIILLYVQDEVTYDRYNKNHEQIYRISSHFYIGGQTNKFALAAPELPPLLMEEYPEIEAFCRIRKIPRLKVTSESNAGYVDGLAWGDTSAFQFFDTEMLYGDPDTCLRPSNAIVISESLSQRFFGDKNPVGDTLITSNRFRYAVTGVFKDLPQNTHHRFEGLLSYNTLLPFEEEPDSLKLIGLWGARDYAFLMLPKDYDVGKFYRGFPAFFEKYMADVAEEFGGWFYPQLTPLAAVHLSEPLQAESYPGGNISYIFSFSIIAFFILLLAGINYVNITTARSTTRIREVGLRKVLGSRRHHLVFQFLGESMLITSIAFLLALGLVEVVLSTTPFNELMGKDLHLNLLHNPALLWGSIGITLLLGLLAGLYPAFFLSSSLPADSLRRRTNKGGGSMALRKGLVVLQFSISIGVIVSTFLMQNQIRFMREQDPGFNTENVAILAVRDTFTKAHLPQIRAEMEALEGVAATTTAFGVPAHSVQTTRFKIEDGDGFQEKVMGFLPVGMDYIQAMDLKISEGRDFIPYSHLDSAHAILVNETGARKLFGGDAIGKVVEWGIEGSEIGFNSAQVIGVVKDFQVASLHNEIEPLFLTPQWHDGGMLHVRITGERLNKTLAEMEEIWRPSEAEGSPFNPFFLDDQFDHLYDADRRQYSLMGILAAICIGISILGLLGFASYTIEQRKREIGIRKVLGASSFRIIRMFIWEVFLLILASSFIAFILGYFAIQWWLQEYAYQAEIHAETFVIAGGIALLVAVATVAGQTLRASLANPVLALKYE